MRTVKGSIIASISIVMAAVFTGFGIFIYHEIRNADLARMDARLQSHADKLREEIEEQIDEHRFPQPQPLRFVMTEGLPGAMFALYDSSGMMLNTDSAFARSGQTAGSLLSGNEGTSEFSYHEIRYRSLLEPTETIDSVTYRLQVAAPLTDIDSELAALRSLLMLAVPAIVLLTALIIYGIVRKGFAPIAAMIHSAEGISAGNLHDRLVLPDARNEVYALGTALNRMMERIESAFRMQKQFVADASHEIRTPLSIIQSELDFVRRATTDPESRESLDTVLTETDHLRKLAADILLLAQLDTASVRLALATVRLDEVVMECVRRMNPIAARKSIVINFQIDEPVELRGDWSRLESVIVNLLDNAIKYSATGGRIDIEIRTRNGWSELRVKDSGAGISSSDLPAIFKRFHRGTADRSDSSGAGLGLAIAQRIVELHGGTIVAESEVGKGSTFTVSLPLVT